MVDCSAEGVVAQDLDDPTVGNAPAPALLDHPFKLAAQRLKALDPLFDIAELRFRDGIRGLAGLFGLVAEAQQVAYGLQGEPQIAQAMGVLKIGTVSLDGTKVKANASKHKAMSWGYANRLEAQLREEVQTLLEQAARADTEASPGLDIPEELARREARLAAIERAKAEIERRAQERYEAEQAEYEEKLKRRRDTEKATGKKARGREPKAPEPGPRAKDQVNFTDEESRIMPSSEGFVQGYNAQAAVDIDSHLIVKAERCTPSASPRLRRSLEWSRR